MRRISLIFSGLVLAIGLGACNAVDLVEPQVASRGVTLSDRCEPPNIEAYGECLPPRGPKPDPNPVEY